jgi:hypothetical protein
MIDPINPYTGQVSVIALMKNLENGHTAFPVIQPQPSLIARLAALKENDLWRKQRAKVAPDEPHHDLMP